MVNWDRSVWFSQNIPKHAFVHWAVVRDRFPTRDRFRWWGLQVPASCLLCNVGIEPRSHLFFECSYSTHAWQSFFLHQRLNPPSSLDHIICWVRSTSPITKLNTICKMVLQATIYGIWEKRNARLHRAETKPSDQVTREVQSIIRRRLAGLDSKIGTSAQQQPTVTSSAHSHLSLWFGYIQFGTDQVP